MYVSGEFCTATGYGSGEEAINAVYRKYIWVIVSLTFSM